jgi:hypothetical protein
MATLLLHNSWTTRSVSEAEDALVVGGLAPRAGDGAMHINKSGTNVSAGERLGNLISNKLSNLFIQCCIEVDCIRGKPKLPRMLNLGVQAMKSFGLFHRLFLVGNFSCCP